MTQVEIAVIGAGTMGMAATAYLAERGLDVVAFDAFDPPHQHGSHHGDTRMIRHAYGEGSHYVELVKRAQVLWEELDAVSDEPIFKRTGVLGLAPRRSPFLQEMISSAKTHGLALDVLTSEEVMRRFAGITIPDDYVGCLETTSGLLFSEHAIRAYRRQAVARGATLHMNTNVTALTFKDDAVHIQTTQGTFVAKRVIVTVGAWAKQLLPTLSLPLQPTRKVVGWFDADESRYGASQFPSFFIEEGSRMYYGFPSLDGAGLKIGRTDGGQPIDPNRHTQNFGKFEEDEADLRHALATYFPDANGPLRQGKTCLYTMSSDQDFIVDHHPDHPNVLIACGFSGHGFKFASVMGEVLSQLILDEPVAFDLSHFSLTRFQG